MHCSFAFEFARGALLAPVLTFLSLLARLCNLLEKYVGFLLTIQEILVCYVKRCFKNSKSGPETVFFF